MAFVLRLVALLCVAGVLLTVRYVIAATDPSRLQNWTRVDRDAYHDAEHDAWYHS